MNKIVEYLSALLPKVPVWVLDTAVKVLLIALTVAVMMLLHKLTARLFVRITDRIARSKRGQAMARKVTTIRDLVLVALKVAFIIFGCVIIFDILGLTGALVGVLTTAGIGGILIALGVQNTVKDFCSGIILALGGQINLGDYVEVNGAIGTVEHISLRTVHIRTFGGQAVIIPAGNISTVTNWSQGDTAAVVDVVVPRPLSVETVETLLAEESEAWAAKNKDTVLTAPRVLGVTAADAGSVTFRVAGRVKGIACWQAELELREAFLKALDARRIRASFPKVAAVHGASEVFGNEL